MKSLLLVLLAIVAIQAKEDRSYVYWVRVWTEANFQGGNKEFHEAVEYLDSYDLDNTIASIEVKGIWIFYEQPEFNTYDSSFVHWAWGLDYRETLHGIQDQVSSFRYAGSQLRLNEAGCNLYAGEMFTKKDLYETNDIPDLSVFHLDVRSVIIIGESKWEFCEGTHYSGRCTCHGANLHDQSYQEQLSVGFYKQLSDMNMYAVRSVRKGCY